MVWLWVRFSLWGCERGESRYSESCTILGIEVLEPWLGFLLLSTLVVSPLLFLRMGFALLLAADEEDSEDPLARSVAFTPVSLRVLLSNDSNTVTKCVE